MITQRLLPSEIRIEFVTSTGGVDGSNYAAANQHCGTGVRHTNYVIPSLCEEFPNSLSEVIIIFNKQY